MRTLRNSIAALLAVFSLVTITSVSWGATLWALQANGVTIMTFATKDECLNELNIRVNTEGRHAPVYLCNRVTT